MFLPLYPTLEWALLFRIPFGISSDHRIGILKSTVIIMVISRFWSWILLKCPPAPPPTGEFLLSRSVVSSSATLWPARAPLSMGFSRQKYWSGLPCPPPGNLPTPGIERRSLTLQAGSLASEPPGQQKQRPLTRRFASSPSLAVLCELLSELLSLLRLCSASVRASLAAQW